MCTHNHPEGVKGAVATATCVYLARNGCSKNEIKTYVAVSYTHLDYITEQINTLHEKNEKIKHRISELESLTKNHLYSSEEFDRTKELLKSFGQSFDTMGVEQKRMALRAFIRRIIWDGKNVHVVLFGDTESEIDYADLAEENQEPNRGDSE